MPIVALYARGPEDIPLLAELTGASESELIATAEAAKAEGKICVFKAFVTEEQYRKFQQLKNEGR